MATSRNAKVCIYADAGCSSDVDRAVDGICWTLRSANTVAGVAVVICKVKSATCTDGAVWIGVLTGDIYLDSRDLETGKQFCRDDEETDGCYADHG